MASAKGNKEGIIYAILSSIFSSVGVIIASEGTRDLSPLLFLSIAGFIGSIILLAFIYFRGGSIKLNDLKKNSKDLITVITVRGVIGQSFLMVGLSITTGIVAIFFTKMEPYFVLLWNWILGKDKLDRKHVFLLAIHLSGAFLLATGGVLSFGAGDLGDLLIIIAVAILALSYIPGRKLSNNLGAINSSAITYGISSIIVLPIALFLLYSSGFSIQSAGWFYVFAEAIFFNVLALTLWFASLKTVKGWIVSALRAIGPLVSAPVAFIFFAQTLTLIQVAGGLIVLITSFVISQESARSK